jgi:hypothetical protein
MMDGTIIAIPGDIYIGGVTTTGIILTGRTSGGAIIITGSTMTGRKETGITIANIRADSIKKSPLMINNL